MLRAAADFMQLAWGLRALRAFHPHSDLEGAIRDQFLHRETHFLRLLREAVYNNPRNPLYVLLREARCEIADVEEMVRTKGLEPSLEILRKAGVWVSQAEFKGDIPILRSGVELRCSPGDFVNPQVSSAWNTATSGTTGTPATVPVSVASRAHFECHQALAYEEFGVRERHHLSLHAILPAPYGVTRTIWHDLRGYRVQHWYAIPGSRKESPFYRAATRLLLAELRMMGVYTPPLSFLPHDDFSPVARDIAEARSRGKLSFISGPASSCTRVASAAIDRHLDISGARFFTMGEGLSPAKSDVIRAAGAESYACYWANELGLIGFGCPHCEGQNTVHLFRDSLALVSYRKFAPSVGAEVSSLLFTTLLPSCPLFFINMELGDHGTIEKAECNCRFSRLGLDTIISEIFSFTKVTSFGTALPAADFVRILESVLPARFGGAPSDYQLVEQEQGSDSRLVLRVNPRLGEVPVEKIRECFLDEVKKMFGGSLTVSMWSHAGVVRVVAAPPIAGRTGKVLPIRVMGRDVVRNGGNGGHAT